MLVKTNTQTDVNLGVFESILLILSLALVPVAILVGFYIL